VGHHERRSRKSVGSPLLVPSEIVRPESKTILGIGLNKTKETSGDREVHNTNMNHLGSTSGGLKCRSRFRKNIPTGDNDENTRRRT
jgi:hypothetical protein